MALQNTDHSQATAAGCNISRGDLEYVIRPGLISMNRPPFDIRASVTVERFMKTVAFCYHTPNAGPTPEALHWFERARAILRQHMPVNDLENWLLSDDLKHYPQGSYAGVLQGIWNAIRAIRRPTVSPNDLHAVHQQLQVPLAASNAAPGTITTQVPPTQATVTAHVAPRQQLPAARGTRRPRQAPMSVDDLRKQSAASAALLASVKGTDQYKQARKDYKINNQRLNRARAKERAQHRSAANSQPAASQASVSSPASQIEHQGCKVR